MPSPSPNKIPSPQSPTDPSPSRNGTGQNEGSLFPEKRIDDTPLPIDPSQEKPELAPLVMAQLDPDAGFNGA